MDSEADGATDAFDEAKAERQRIKRAVRALGWKFAGPDSVEIGVEREFHFGLRYVAVRGRVVVPRPDELSAEGGAAAVAPIVDPAVAKFRHSIERAASKILSEPDDVPQRLSFKHHSFFSALEEAQRSLVRAYQELENERVERRVEADLGLKFYVEGFTKAERKFEYFAGPTNSGKTHAALELLREAGRGVYLAPLRLLALEVQERLNDLGVSTSLVTGEERVLMPGAGHVSSTVEMVDLGREFDVAVVDEAQMLQDPQRGWAWTLAIAGVRAPRVVLCGSEDGLGIAERLAQKLGVELAVRRFERKSPLAVVDAVSLSQLGPKDAVIAFTRNDVVDLQRRISRAGLETAAIYGSLSPAVRRREAERFRTGKATVLVATDAIGLGLNLPIRRLVFAEIEKFDGVVRRRLTPAEVRQIAGRAGRFGMHEQGLVTAIDPKAVRYLRSSLDSVASTDQSPIWISPTDDHLRRLSAIIGTDRVGRLLQFFQTRVLRGEDAEVRIADLTDTIEVANLLESSPRFLNLPLEVRCTYSRAPVSTRGNALAVLGGWGEQHAAAGIVEGWELVRGTAARDRLLAFEDRSRLATLYLWLAQRFPDVYVNGLEMQRVRERTDDAIHTALREHSGKAAAPAHKPLPPRRKGPPKFNKRKLPK